MEDPCRFAAVRLSALAAYLKTKQGTKKREGDDIATLIDENLCPAMFTDPDNERAVQDVIETIFRVRSLDFRRDVPLRGIRHGLLFS